MYDVIMKAGIILDFDRGPNIITAQVTGRVFKSYGYTFVKDFECDADLRQAELEYAEERLIESAQMRGLIEEIEPDAKPRMGHNCY